MGERNFAQMVLVTWPRWPPCPYVLKTLKQSSSLEPKGFWPWNLVCIIECSSSIKSVQKMTLGFMWNLHRMGEWKLVQMVQVTWPIWPPCPYMVKTLKTIFFFGTKQLMTLKVGIQHRVLEYYQVYSNNDPGLTLTYLMARSNLIPYAFIWGKR